MNQTKYKRPLIVGIFIFAGLAIFILGVFTVGSQQKIFQKKISLKVIFDNVGGLQPGNNVWLSGVKVGTVKKIEFYGEMQVQITLNVEKIAQPHIYKDALAKIATDGFIGNKIVVIYGGTPKAGMVETGNFLECGKGISTDDMMTTLQSSNRNLQEITSDFKKIAGKLASGEGTIGKLINDSLLVMNIQSTVRNLKITSLRSEEAMANIVRFTERLDKQDGLLNKLMSDTAIFNQLKETVDQLKEASSTASAFMDTLQQASGALNNQNTTVGMLLKDEELAKNIREIIINLNKSSEKLDEDLEALQHNFLLKGYFKKHPKPDTAGH